MCVVLLGQPWPPDLHPSRVPFKRRTLTVVERAGLFANPAAINDLTEDDVVMACGSTRGSVAGVRWR